MESVDKLCGKLVESVESAKTAGSKNGGISRNFECVKKKYPSVERFSAHFFIVQYIQKINENFLQKSEKNTCNLNSNMVL